MQISCVLLILFTSLIMRETAAQFPYSLMYTEDHSPLFLLAVATDTTRSRSIPGSNPINIPRSITGALPVPQCSSGYTLYSGPGRSFCFLYASNCASFTNAQTACSREGGGLLVLDDESLLPFLADMRQRFPTTFSCTTPNIVWLNARTNTTLGAVYPIGRSIPLSGGLWAPGEPNAPNDCVTVEISNGESILSDNPCTQPEKYVCQQF
ncbi:hypothetical protein ACJMK2_002917 [Sinanodonta woodiana]|uniref:C-type lectin domain-containing protein n=1 Tax=Sinanodonta woodiana TaxID=1069815 RepID=A0ABD3XYB0_SINWO